MKAALVWDLPTGLFLLPLIGTTIMLGKIDQHHGVQWEDDDD